MHGICPHICALFDYDMTTTTRAYLSLAAICVIWGTTYTAIKYAVRDFPPFLLVGVRQCAAGMMLILLALLNHRIMRRRAENQGTRVLTPRYIALQVLTGLFTITGGNGFITWAMQYVPSGLSAVIGALTPVVVVLINMIWQGGERITNRALAGVLLGFVGLGLIFNDGWSHFLEPNYALGIAGCFASCFSWSLGTVMAKRYNSTAVSPLTNAGIQVAAGGLGGFLLSAFFDTSHTINHTTTGWLSVLYLATIGSALAFTLYMYALKHLSATVSSLYTYINPVVAVLLGWLLLGETLTPFVMGGMGITIVGVWLVNEGMRRG